MIQEFEKARKQEVDAFERSTNDLKRKTAKFMTKEVARLKSSMDQVKKMQVADLEKEWEDQQRKMWTKLNVALKCDK